MKMKLWTVLGFALLFIASAIVQISGQTSVSAAGTTNPASTPSTNTQMPAITDKPDTTIITTKTNEATTSTRDELCVNIKDFEPCINPKDTICTKNSKCFCKNQIHFCRCNNDKDTWYIGENCDQKWTVTTFALVASLPGVALAAIVGVAVHFFNSSKKKGSGKSSSKAKKTVKQLPLDENKPGPANMYSNPVFSSDLQGGQMTQPASATPSQDRIPMAARPSNPYNYVSSQPSMNQSYNNPYVKSQPSRNPYNSFDRNEDYRRSTDPTAGQNGMARGGFTGYNQASLSTPSYSIPDYNSSKSQLPRAHVGRQY